MRIRFHLAAVCLVAPLSLFAQTPAAPPPADAARAPASAAAESKPNDDAKADIDPAVVEAIRKAFAAQRAKGSFRAHMESTGLGGASIPTVEMEFVFPDRMKMKMADVEVVGVGDKTMMKMG
jgi:hypothetical protein